jgi:hypothetical protein
MSAFMVEDETINSVITYLAKCSKEKELWKLFPLESLGYFNRENMDSFNAAQMGLDMFELNTMSIEQRYGKGQAGQFRPLDYKPSHCYRNSVFQVLKDLSCFLYQSCEGNCDETPLYKALREIEGKIALEIVHRLPQYESAKWS